MSHHDFINQLAALVDDKGLLLDDAETAPYLVDWRGLFRGKALAVIRPRNAIEVGKIARLCSMTGVAIVPQGGNTGLAGGAVPTGPLPQIVMSLSRMNAIRQIDRSGMTMEVEAGCILQNAQQAAREIGRLLPISFAAEGSAQIGGVLANNAGGVNVVRYGMARQLVLGLEVVLSDGTLVTGLRKLRKDNAGYDWKQIFIGSEGTLGIITAAVLRLMIPPKHEIVALLSVPDPAAALRLLNLAQDIIGDQICAFELVSAFSFDLVARHCGLALPVPPSPWYVLLQAGSSLAGLAEAVEQMLSDAIENGVATDGVIASSVSQAQQLWSWRERISEAERFHGDSIKHDVSVPVASVPSFLRNADEEIQRCHPNCALNIFGHLGDGSIHFNVLGAAETDRPAIMRRVHDVVALHSGSIAAEHGIGQYRTDELTLHKSASELGLMTKLKRALDQDGILNPMKILSELVTRG